MCVCVCVVCVCCMCVCARACERCVCVCGVCVCVCVCVCGVCVCVCVCVCVMRVCTVCAKKKLPLPFNETERNGSFRSRYIIFRYPCYPFWIHSRSVHIFRPFWTSFNLFPCCAICFNAWQFMILIKERACMLLTGRMVFSDYTKKRILFYHAKGSHARSHHTHARSHHAHAKSHTYFASRTFLLLFLPTLS